MRSPTAAPWPGGSPSPDSRPNPIQTRKHKANHVQASSRVTHSDSNRYELHTRRAMDLVPGDEIPAAPTVIPSFSGHERPPSNVLKPPDPLWNPDCKLRPRATLVVLSAHSSPLDLALALGSSDGGELDGVRGRCCGARFIARGRVRAPQISSARGDLAHGLFGQQDPIHAGEKFWRGFGGGDGPGHPAPPPVTQGERTWNGNTVGRYAAAMCDRDSGQVDPRGSARVR
jgi:hypothetical protein